MHFKILADCYMNYNYLVIMFVLIHSSCFRCHMFFKWSSKSKHIYVRMYMCERLQLHCSKYRCSRSAIFQQVSPITRLVNSSVGRVCDILVRLADIFLYLCYRIYIYNHVHMYVYCAPIKRAT